MDTDAALVRHRGTMTKTDGLRLRSHIVDEAITLMPAERVRSAALAVVEHCGGDMEAIGDIVAMLGISTSLTTGEACDFSARDLPGTDHAGGAA